MSFAAHIVNVVPAAAVAAGWWWWRDHMGPPGNSRA